MGDERIEALEQRIVELGDGLMRLQKEVNYLRSATIYAFGALGDLYLNSEGSNTIDYRDKLDRISTNIKGSISVNARLENPDEQDQDTVITDFETYRRRAGRSPAQAGGDGGGGSGGDLNRRVTALEAAVDKIDGKLDKIIEVQAAERLANEQRFGSIGERFGLIGERLASIEAKLEAKASAAEL